MKTKIDELRKHLYERHKDCDFIRPENLYPLLDIIEKQHNILNMLYEGYCDTTEDADTGVFYELFPENSLDDIADVKRLTTEMLNNIEL